VPGDKDLLYRLVIADDGTPTLRIVGEAGKKMGADVSAAADQAAASLNKMSAAADKAGKSQAKLSAEARMAAESTAAGFAMTTKMAEQANFWMSSVGRGQTALIQKEKEAAESRKKGTEEIKKQEVATSSLNRTMERIQRTVAAFVGVWAFQKVVSGLSGMVKGGIEFNAVMEESRLGMAAIFMAQGQFVTASGRAQEGMEALNSSMEMSTKISKQLQLDNLRTAATYQQLVKAYQQTIAPGLAVGFNPEQIREYTVAMVQAASALGLNLDMLAEETRSMLRGAITPRNTLIATALGIRNEDIQRYRGDVDGLYKYVMGRLSAFGVAGEAVQMTWKGAISNVKDVIQIVLGEGFTNLFDYLKQEALNLQKMLVKWTIKGPELDKEVVDAFSAMGQAIIEIIEGTKTWIKSLSGLLPIFGLVYQILRLIGLALTPLVELLGTAITAAGELARTLAGVLKVINDVTANFKPLQTALGGISAYLIYILAIASSIGAFASGTSSWFVRLASSLSGWLAPLAAIALLFISVRDAISTTATTWQSLSALLKAGLVATGILLFSTVVPGLIAAVAGMSAFIIPVAAAVVLFNDLSSGVQTASPLVEVLRAAFVMLGVTILSTMGPIGMVLAGIMALAEAWNLLKKAGFGESWGIDVGIEGAALSGAAESEVTKSLAEQATFKQNIIKLDEKQTDALLKLTQLTGEISEEDRRRMTTLNDITGLYQDQYKEFYKQIDLMNSDKFKMPEPEFEWSGIDFMDQFTGKGLSGVTMAFEEINNEVEVADGRAKAFGETMKKIAAESTTFAEDMADLPKEMQLYLAVLSNEWTKWGLEIDVVKERLKTLIPQMKEKMDLRVGLDIANIESQIASQNKNYEEQARLVDVITAAKIRQIGLDFKGRAELEAAMNKMAEQQKKRWTA
jgi:hypothetical protein